MRKRRDVEKTGNAFRDPGSLDDVGTVLGQVLRCAALPAPTVDECARLIDSAAGDPERSRVLAALLQRATADRELGERLTSLASLARDAGCLAPGHACQALAAETDLAKLLAAGLWIEVSEVLGKDHTPHEHLLKLAHARLGRQEGGGGDLRQVIWGLENDLIWLALQNPDGGSGQMEWTLQRLFEDGGARLGALSRRLRMLESSGSARLG